MAVIPRWIYRNPIFIIIFLILVLDALYVYTTPFSKTITVANHGNTASGRIIIPTISDDAGNVYVVSNQIFLLHFNATQLALMFENGSHFKVGGYGYNIPALGIYPNITSATKLSA